MQTRKLGPFEVSAIGLGAMPVSMNSDNKFPDEDQAIRTIHAALDAGVTFIDTADIYAPSWDTMGHNELLVGKAVKKSLTNLGVDVIDLYQWHRPDRWKVYGDVIANFKTLQDEGLIKTIGISNANVEEIQVAIDVLGEGGLVSVQNEFSPRFRSSQDELEFCDEHGIAFLPWSPLGGTGGGAREVGNKFAAFAEIAADHGVSPQQVVLAWELSLSDSAKAADLVLSEDELARCSASGGA